MSSRLTEMIQFLYERQIMHFAEQWTVDLTIPAEFKRRWQVREVAFEMFTADESIKLGKRLDAGELPPPSDVH